MKAQQPSCLTRLLPALATPVALTGSPQAYPLARQCAESCLGKTCTVHCQHSVLSACKLGLCGWSTGLKAWQIQKAIIHSLSLSVQNTHMTLDGLTLIQLESELGSVKSTVQAGGT